MVPKPRGHTLVIIAPGDIEALRSVFDSNKDGKLDANDAGWSNFRIERVLANGTTEVKTLAELGISSIDLTANATRIVLPDGSVITGQTTYTKAGGGTGTVANTTLAYDGDGNRVIQTVTTNGSGQKTTITHGRDTDGDLAYRYRSVAEADGSTVTNSYDDNGDHQYERSQVITRATDGSGTLTETITDYDGEGVADRIMTHVQQTVSSADGVNITVNRDSTGAGWFDEREVHSVNGSGQKTVTISELANNGAVISSESTVYATNLRTRTTTRDSDGDGRYRLSTNPVAAKLPVCRSNQPGSPNANDAR